MRLKICNFKIYLVQLLVLGATVTHAFPNHKNNSSTTIPIKDQNKKTTKANTYPEPANNDDQLEEKSPFSSGLFKNHEKNKDFIMYQENRDDTLLKYLCWAELHIVTENNKNNERNLSNEFAIILESPGEIAQPHTEEKEVETYILFDTETNKSIELNFTTINRTNEITIREHKTLHCGSGPVMVTTYMEWPKKNKRKIEIRLIPSTPSKWQIYNDLDYVEETFTTSATSQTFDTIRTEDYSQINFVGVTESSGAEMEKDEENYKPKSKNNKTDNLDKNIDFKKQPQNIHDMLAKSFQNQQNRNVKKDSVLKSPNVNFKIKEDETKSKPKTNKTDKINKNIGYEKRPNDNNTFTKSSQSQHKPVKEDSILKSSNVNFKIDGDQTDDPELGMRRELLTRNMYFAKLSDTDSIFNVTEPNLFISPDYDSAFFFFDLLYPNKSTSFGKLRGKHKFLMNVQFSVKHFIIENVNGTEKERQESIMALEEESVYRLKR